METRQKDVLPPSPAVRLVWDEFRRGAGHFQPRIIPLPVNRLGQFVHGLCLPFHLVRLLFTERPTRRRYLSVALAQSAVILALGLFFTGTGDVIEGAARAVSEEPRQVVLRAAYWVALFSALQVVQWVVIALSRDYHTVLEREASLLSGLPPEDEPLTPRVRLNLPWLRNKLKRRWRGLVVFAVGVPLLWLGCLVVPKGKYLLPVLMSLWAAWWFVVFTAAKTARAWEDKAPREPWFLRGWGGLASRVPVFRWAPFSMYSSVWTTFTRPVFSPAARVEQRPWALGGLAVVRALAMLPLVKCFLRPVIPVAAAHLLAASTGPGETEGVPNRDGPSEPWD